MSVSNKPRSLDEFYEQLVVKVIEQVTQENRGPARVFGCAMIPNIMPLILRWDVKHPLVKITPQSIQIEPTAGWNFQLTGDFSQIQPEDGCLLNALKGRKCPISSITVMSSPLHVRSTVTGTDCNVLISNSEIILNMMGQIYSSQATRGPQLDMSSYADEGMTDLL